jgi:hypothetical protein
MRRLLLAAMLGFGVAASGAGAQTISERIADGSRKPGTPVVIGMLGEPIPLSIEDLAKQSDLIVEARVTPLKTYINSADTAVITEFSILPIQVLAGTVPSAAKSPGVTRLLLSSYGGEVVRNGVTVRAENHGLEQLKPGGAYLLFLKRFGQQEGVYQIFNAGAFELSNNTIRPLARPGELYREFYDVPYGQVVRRVTAGAGSR